MCCALILTENSEISEILDKENEINQVTVDGKVRNGDAAARKVKQYKMKTIE